MFSFFQGFVNSGYSVNGIAPVSIHISLSLPPPLSLSTWYDLPGWLGNKSDYLLCCPPSLFLHPPPHTYLGQKFCRSNFSCSFIKACPLPLPWYNRTGWLGVKHQLIYLLPPPFSQWSSVQGNKLSVYLFCLLHCKLWQICVKCVKCLETKRANVALKESYLLNLSTFHNTACYCGASLWARISCKN